MANERNKSEQVLSVESRLKALYDLQTILSKIDRIHEVRGELPEEVSKLEDSIVGLERRVKDFENEIEDLRRKTAEEKEKINHSNDVITRYKAQLDDVRNNREFDLLSKEIEFQTLEIELSEKHIREFSRMIDERKNDIQKTHDTLADHHHILEEKKAELSEIVSETRKEEETLRQQAKALEESIDDERLLKAFRRIRKSSRNGLGIVCVQRNACGGCFNRIPPQRQMEIKMHKKVIVCEYCGRLIIDPDLANPEEA